MCLVALQLDHMVATIAQVTLMFSVLLTFLIFVDQDRQKAGREFEETQAAPTDAASTPLLR